jgi:hypothetical protein
MLPHYIQAFTSNFAFEKVVGKFGSEARVDRFEIFQAPLPAEIIQTIYSRIAPVINLFINVLYFRLGLAFIGLCPAA